MSVEVFCYRLGKTQLAAADKKWMPLWLEKYASTSVKTADGNLVLTKESVFDFLVKLKKGGTPAWQRLQAARTLEWYQKLILDGGSVDFGEFIKGLLLLAAKEKQTKQAGNAGLGLNRGRAEIEGLPGEGLPGLIDETEPLAVQELRKRMRVLHNPRSTEDAFVSWLARFMKFWDTEDLGRLGEQHIGEFLTDLAVTGEVVAGTQNQALCAVLYYYQHVAGREMHFIDRVKAKASTYLPVVLSRSEIAQIDSLMGGVEWVDVSLDVWQRDEAQRVPMFASERSVL